MTRPLNVLDAMVEELVEGIAYDVAGGASPEGVVAMTVAMYRDRPGVAAELLGAALLRLAEESR